MKRLFLLTLAFATIHTHAGDNWPQWRGPNLDGTADAKNLPVTWSETENVIWKVKLPWRSAATPAIWGDHIFVISASPAKPDPALTPNQVTQLPGGDELLLLCLSRQDGRVLWQREVGRGNQAGGRQNMASISPVTDGECVWAMTGMGDLAAFDFNGRELWRRNIHKDYGPLALKYGYASSPLLLDNRLIVEILHKSTNNVPSCLLALDKLTGKKLWRTERRTDALKESKDAYTTPALLRRGKQVEVVVNGGDAVTGHDPATGKELWRVTGVNAEHRENHRSITSPLCVGDVIIAPSKRNPMLAIKAGGHGDISKTHELWRYDRGPDVPTPVSDGKHVWIVDDSGLLSCLDLRTGAPAFAPQPLVKGKVSASPVLADGKIFAINEAGMTTVLAAKPEFAVLATNKLDAALVMATPVIVGDRIYIRSASHLYCIGKK
ncbi:MAG: PQQ-like beta-propeller repeat protein [Verrucomicrobia bacterium]|nr:PQQ-like beta-propeller repeat protein [Verrucomicrobiota bacterium]